MALEHLLTGNLNLPVGKGFTLIEMRGMLRIVSLEEHSTWNYERVQVIGNSHLHLLWELSKIRIQSCILLLYFNTRKGGRYVVHAVAARLIGKYWHIHDPN
jgi:hypothetical protein